MQRDDLEEVPGCIGSGSSGWDYCYDPRPGLTYIGDDGRHGECEGDCDDELDCAVSDAKGKKPALF
jgi:hypothetical protein